MMKTGQIAPLRPASTVIVLREGAAPFEVLMVRRNDKVAFMAGAYVFPGGRVDEGDAGGPEAVAVWVNRGHAPRFDDHDPGREWAYRRAAARELTEEANVRVAPEDLEPLAHWVTPEIEIRRYDTRFFLARMPAGQEARHDESETTALAWLTPEDAIAKCRRHEILLPPPTWTTLRQLGRCASIDAAFAWARERSIRARAAGLHPRRDPDDAHAAGRPAVPDAARMGSAGGNAIRARGREPMVTAEAVTPIIDEVIALFNRKAMDLPDGFFDRKTQFVLNGAPFETLLGQPPADPLVLMLTRGPAGYRFACKGLQHAMPDAAIERGEISVPAEGNRVTARLWLSGHLHTTGDPLDTVVTVDLRFAPAGWVEVAEATVDAGALDLLRAARLAP